MMQVSRRVLLSTTALPLLSVASCAGNGTGVQIGATAITAIATGVQALLPVLQAAGVTVAGGLANIVSQIESAAQQVAASPTATAASSWAATVVADVETILTAVAGNVTLPAVVQKVLQALQVALPIIETAWSVVAPLVGVAAARHMAARRMFANAVPMSTIEAISILNGARALLAS